MEGDVATDERERTKVNGIKIAERKVANAELPTEFVGGPKYGPLAASFFPGRQVLRVDAISLWRSVVADNRWLIQASAIRDDPMSA